MVYAGLTQEGQVMAKYSVHTGDYRKIISAVCIGLQIDNRDLVGKSRERDISDARKIAFRLLRDLSRLTLVQIGKLFGKEHSTVVHALTSFDELYQFDPAFKAKFNRVKSLL